jgi:hypothetical protein
MAVMTRRALLLAAAALPLGCATRDRDASAEVDVGAAVRAPKVGQSWRYRKLDMYHGRVIETELARVSAIGETIEVEVRPDLKEVASTYPSWGQDWLKKYANDWQPGHIPAEEVQSPWGMILMDSHWARMQVFEEPIPLWPLEVRPGWSKTVGTNYRTAESPHESLPWQLTMHAHNWESITVPAGRFKALRYSSIIDFRYSQVSERVSAQRLEMAWFAPEIGRWAAREAQGSFYQDVGERFREDAYRWELQDWT